MSHRPAVVRRRPALRADDDVLLLQRMVDGVVATAVTDGEAPDAVARALALITRVLEG